MNIMNFSLAGNATIGLEILEDLPDVDTVIGPFGGGGHLCGIASAIKHHKPGVTVVACEVETAAPLTESRRQGKPSTLTDHRTSFVDGMGGRSVFPEMWRLASSLIDVTVPLSVAQIADAVRTLVTRNRVVAEGAGAAPVAAALSGAVAPGNIVCVISGGNIDTAVLTQILQGQVPQ
jgi:threonine dehydratase